MTELKPCPFCGSKKLKIDYKASLYGYNGMSVRCEKHTYSVRCNVCHARGGAIGGLVAKGYNGKANIELTSDGELEEKAIALWNRREGGLS